MDILNKRKPPTFLQIHSKHPGIIYLHSKDSIKCSVSKSVLILRICKKKKSETLRDWITHTSNISNEKPAVEPIPHLLNFGQVHHNALLPKGRAIKNK